MNYPTPGQPSLAEIFGTTDYDNDEYDEVDGELSLESKSKYTFSYSDHLSFRIACYVIDKYLQHSSSDSLVTVSKVELEMNYDVDKFETILVFGNKVYTTHSKIVSYSPCIENLTIGLHTTGSINALVEILKNEIRTNNPLRGKNLQIVMGASGFDVIYKPVPKTTFDDVILNQAMKDDIYDNTIFQLKNIDSNNGIIFTGQPGTGKSIQCQAIIHEAIKEGFSTCFIVDAIDYSALKEFIHTFLSECIVIIEDIDGSLGQSREHQNNPHIASFLQFINGVSENNDKLVFIATTNYLEHLDKAIRNRPVRFNRKFEFKYPNDGEMDRMLDLFFKDIALTKDQHSLCYEKNFTGSHVNEIHRTATLLSKKHGKPLVDVFNDAVKAVEDNFSTTLTKQVGFGS